MGKASSALRTRTPARMAWCLLTASAMAMAANVTFTEPVGGSVHAIGEYLHIEFVVDSSANFINQVFGISVNDGLTYAILPVIMNGTDTITANRRYDWLITSSVHDEFGNNSIDYTVSTTCRFRMLPYPGGGGNGNGVTDAFTIIPASATRRSAALPHERYRAGQFRILAPGDQSISNAATPAGAVIAVFSIDGRFRAAVDLGRMLRSPGTAAGMSVLQVLPPDVPR